ncbi:MAG TPA: AI-2E family transporter [Methylocella sp.]|nr:AI-2E family transporter [Methylocella sp.]
MSNDEAGPRSVREVGHSRFLTTVFTVVIISAALYFARSVLEPIAFMLFVMALVGPFQYAAEIRTRKWIALILTILMTLFVLSLLVLAIVWSIGEVAHWGLANVDKFQSLAVRVKQWLENYDLFVVAFSKVNSASFVGLFQAIAAQVNYFLSFVLVVFLFLIFGLAEMTDFKDKLAELDKGMSGWSLLETCGRISEKIRKYMLIRTIASAVTGVAVFLFTLAIGLDLAIAWGVLSFVLNYIPYIGPLIAVILPVIFAMAQFESWPMAVMIFGSLYLIQLVIGNYLEPMLTGNALAISPLVMLVAFFIWNFLWGLPGAFIGLPVTIALFTIWEQNPSTRWVARLMSTSQTVIGTKASPAN